MSLGDQVEIAKKSRTDEVEASVMMLCSSIKSWTLKNPDGVSTPINRENILKLRMDLVNNLTKDIYTFNALNPDQLKNL